MKILTIDTSFRPGLIGFVDDDRVVFEKHTAQNTTHSEQLFTVLEEGLSLTGWLRADFQAIVAGVGPGSFTGLRIGLAAAKGLCMGWDIPLVGISSLEALAKNVPAKQDVIVVPMIDAARGEVYVNACDLKSHECLLSERALPPDILCDKLLEMAQGRQLHLIGDGAVRYQNLFTERLGQQLSLGSSDQHVIHASSMASLALAKLTQGVDELISLAPRYIRPSDAERKYDEKNCP